MNCAIVSCIYGKACECEESLITLRSFSANVRPHGVKMFWITDNMPKGMRNECKWNGCEVITVNDDFSANAWKQRHLWYAKLGQEWTEEFDLVLSIDAKDSCFFSNPFCLEVGDSVLVSQEACTIGDCDWNSMDVQISQGGCRTKLDLSKEYILNGGFISASPNLFTMFSLARYAFDAKVGADHSDQGSLNYLSRIVKGLVLEVPASEPWIGHGHHFAKWPQPHPDYAILHQWNRIAVPDEIRKPIIDEYGG